MYKHRIIVTILSLFVFFFVKSVAIANTDEPTLQDYERFALVIGNKDYEYRPLSNPVNDARAIKAFLLSKQFKDENIIYAENADLATLKSKKETFLARLSAAKKSIAFVYYSGHGTQETSRDTNKLTNYLIPVNNQRIKTVTRLDMYSVSLNELLGDMDELNHGLNIVLLDACRDGLPAFTKSAHSASFAPMDAKGVFIVYATDSGNTANDDSLFRKSFIEQAKLPQNITDVFTAVKKSLYDTSQVPVFTDRTTGGDFYFTGSADDDPAILKANYFLAKTYENKALLALIEGDKTKDLTEYRKAWLYGLEAQKLKIPAGRKALKQTTLNKLTELSASALNPEKYEMPAFLDLGSSVEAITYHPKEPILASGLKGGTIMLWDTKSGRLKQTLKGDKRGVTTLSYSPDGQVLASTSWWGGIIELWDAQSGLLKQTIKVNKKWITDSSYNPNGQVLASASISASGWDGEVIELWDTQSWKLKQTLKGHGSSIFALSYSPDGQMLASGESNSTIKLWDVQSGTLKKTLKGHEDYVTALRYSPDGQLLVSASEDKAIKLWDVQSGQLKQTLKGHDDGITALIYSPDGQVLASASEDKTIKLWDTQSGQLKQTLKGHDGGVKALSYNPDGQVLASASSDKAIKLWNVQSGQLKKMFKGHKHNVAVLSSNEQVLVSEDERIKLWDAQSGQLKQTLKNEGPVSTLSYHPNGKVLAFAGSRNGTIKILDVQSGQLKQTLKRHKSRVTALNYSPDGRMLASASLDDTINFWDSQSGQLKQSVTALSYSPNRQVLASPWGVYDVQSGQLKQTLKRHIGQVAALSYSPDGQVLALASADKIIKLWDTQSGQLKQTLKGHDRDVTALSYSPDGQLLASGSRDHTIKLWDVQSRQLKQILKGHKWWITALSYSPDGQVLASASRNGTIKLWDAQSGQLKQTLKGDKSWVTALSHSPNNHILTSVSNDGTIKRWPRDILQTQALFYQYDPKHVSNVLKFLWEMGLDDDKLEMVHKVRTPILYPLQGRYYADTQYLPLLEYPAKGKTKADQLLEWLEKDSKARQKKQAVGSKASKHAAIPAQSGL